MRSGVYEYLVVKLCIRIVSIRHNSWVPFWVTLSVILGPSSSKEPEFCDGRLYRTDDCKIVLSVYQTNMNCLNVCSLCLLVCLPVCLLVCLGFLFVCLLACVLWFVCFCFNHCTNDYYCTTLPERLSQLRQPFHFLLLSFAFSHTPSPYFSVCYKRGLRLTLV